jgi:hypothetical protein
MLNPICHPAGRQSDVCTTHARPAKNQARFTDHARVGVNSNGIHMKKRVVRAIVPGSEFRGDDGKIHGVSLLSNASKMPTLSFSLPAGESCPWAHYGPGSICGECYAQKGRYTSPVVAHAQQVRWAWVRACMKTPAGTDAFVTAMVSAITDARNSYFRGHDSGDFFSPAYLRAWIRICRALPDVRFWFPTRTWRALLKAKGRALTEWTEGLTELAGLPNVALRPSALLFGAPSPRIPFMAAGTTARDEGFSCPASEQGNVCGPCRVCFDAVTVEVSYHRH